MVEVIYHGFHKLENPAVPLAAKPHPPPFPAEKCREGALRKTLAHGKSKTIPIDKMIRKLKSPV
jgi:hypothetical protein